MASLPFRTRDPQPDIRARISIHDESSDDIRRSLQAADETQKALRSQQSWHRPEPNDPIHRGVLRKSRTQPHPYHAGNVGENTTGDIPCSSDWSNSLNSLSTSQRETEAAALSQYRDSPISAISPRAAPTWRHEPQNPHFPQPQPRVETLSEQQKYQKILKKSLKKKHKEQIKAQKEDEQLRREEAAAARRRTGPGRGDILPSRSKGTTRAIATQLVKSLSLKRPLSKLSRRRRQEGTPPPTLDHFNSKQEIHDYLNPSPASTCAGVVELPAELPQYTPFQDSTRTQHNQRESPLEDVAAVKEKEQDSKPSKPEATLNTSETPPRSMRCDSCKSPIRLNQVYYHCSICENGDRILCSLCDQAGWSCRHVLTERVRSVTRAVSSETDTATVKKDQSRLFAQQYAAAMAGLATADFSSETRRWTDGSLQATMSAVNPRSLRDALDRNKSRRASLETKLDAASKPDHVKETELHRRERDMIAREKEVAIRERETAVREQQASLREQKAVLAIKQQLFALQLQSAILQPAQEASVGIGSQCRDLTDVSAHAANVNPPGLVSHSACSSAEVLIAETCTQDDHIRKHGTKRKSGGERAAISPANAPAPKQQTPLKRSPRGGQESSDEDDEDTAGTPKKIKTNLDVQRTGEKLFACPFSKFSKSRYSEQNRHEKHYRRCLSGYWTDISRLKQHLYRVHSLQDHCGRCWARFKNKDQLEAHMHAELCLVIDCKYPEKFGEEQGELIRRKRPGNSAEQVWYIIYDILFPGHPRPESPYADNVDTPPQSAVSPATAEWQNMVDTLKQIFESRLNRHVAAPGQEWLCPETLEFIRQQFRESTTDFLGRLTPASSFAAANPSSDSSPRPILLPESTPGSSIPMTAASSLPVSPISAVGPRGTDPPSHFLYPGHGPSYSRPFKSRTSLPKDAFEQGPVAQHVGWSPTGSRGGSGQFPPAITFPAPSDIDAEHDQYDDQCNSWSHGDEVGLALSTDFNYELGASFPSAEDEVKPVQTSSVQHPISTQEFIPVKLSSVVDAPGEAESTVTSHLKANHSASSSIDSGYGSIEHASGTASPGDNSVPSRARQSRPKRENMKGSDRQADGASVPALDEEVNYGAFDIPFEEFLGRDLDEFGNIAGQPFAAYLDTRYPAAARRDHG